jgi:hypothetical protein
VARAKKALVTADELMWWTYGVVARDAATPKQLRGVSLRKATDQLARKGIDEHDLVGVDDKAAPVRFSGARVIQAWLGAIVIAHKDQSVMSRALTAETWKAIAPRTKPAELEFRVFELLCLPPDRAMERAWRAEDHAGWRYALALAQGRPLMAKLWRAK